MAGRPTAIVVSLFFSLVCCCIAFLAIFYRDLFGRLMFEDHWAEWATCYAFAMAGIVGLFELIKSRGVNARPESQTRASRITLLLLSSFCLLAAAEEISWGQRLLGVRPPELFQRFNYQQELNIHNVLHYFVSAELVFNLICWGYGVALPLLVRYGKPTNQGGSASVFFRVPRDLFEYQPL